MLFIILAILFGVLAGTFTGLIPGVHVNLITTIVISLALPIPPEYKAIFIVSLATTHSFLATIPSVFLGAPDPSTVVSVLPGHRMVLEGKGHVAVVLTLVGSLGGLIFTLLAMPLAFPFLEQVQVVLQPVLGYILLGVVGILLIMSRKVLNIAFFVSAGVLGLCVFALPSAKQVLLPLLSGLFGTSTLLTSLCGAVVSPRQQLICKNIHIPESAFSRGTLVGILASFFPGLGASQGAIIAAATTKKNSPEFYLVLVGVIGTVNFVFSLLTVFVLEKARNGAIVGVNELVVISQELFFILCAVTLIAGGVATISGIRLSKLFAQWMDKVNYNALVWSVIMFILILVALLSGRQGILILLTATGLGILAQHFGAQKNMLLGCLLIPVLSYFL